MITKSYWLIKTMRRCRIFNDTISSAPRFTLSDFSRMIWLQSAATTNRFILLTTWELLCKFFKVIRGLLVVSKAERTNSLVGPGTQVWKYGVSKITNCYILYKGFSTLLFASTWPMEISLQDLLTEFLRLLILNIIKYLSRKYMNRL